MFRISCAIYTQRMLNEYIYCYFQYFTYNYSACNLNFARNVGSAGVNEKKCKINLCKYKSYSYVHLIHKLLTRNEKKILLESMNQFRPFRRSRSNFDQILINLIKLDVQFSIKIWSNFDQVNLIKSWSRKFLAAP